ncbi:MAG TPA: hypothetical protein PKY53_07120 [Clostridia bacterium]|nr:hypothetical protein [Clostridia bacterium]
MPIRNSYYILMCNFKLVYKLLFFILIIMLIAVAISFSIINPILEGYFDTVRDQFDYVIDDMVKHPIKTLQSFFEMFLDYVDVHSATVSLRLINLSLIIIAVRFFVVLPILPVAMVLFSKMTTNFDKGLFNTFVSCLPQCLLYTLITSIIFGIIDLALAVGIVFLAVQLIKLLGFIGLPISLAIAIAVYSLRMTIVCQWMPEICQNNGKKIFSAFKSSMKPMAKQFTKNLICITVVNTVSVTLIATTFIPTAGLVPILLIPTLAVLYQSLYLALNFAFRHQKYFIDNGVTIYDPTKKF